MMTVLCLTILAYYIMGKDVRPLMSKIKNVDWKRLAGGLKDKLRPYAQKAGRVTARPLLQFYFVMQDEKTTALDRVLIYAAIFYTVSPSSLIPASVFKLLGVLDEGAAVVYVYKKVKGKITPEINRKVEAVLDRWFEAKCVPAE